MIRYTAANGKARQCKAKTKAQANEKKKVGMRRKKRQRCEDNITASFILHTCPRLTHRISRMRFSFRLNYFDRSRACHGWQHAQRQCISNQHGGWIGFGFPVVDQDKLFGLTKDAHRFNKGQPKIGLNDTASNEQEMAGPHCNAVRWNVVWWAERTARQGV